MLKKLFWAIVMVTIAACTVILGEGFSIPGMDPTATAIVTETEIPFPTEIVVDPTATVIIVPTAEETQVVPTATEIIEVPTETQVPPTQTVVPPTATIIPPTPTFTPTAVPPTATLAPTAITEKFTIQAATPIFMANFAHTAAGCNWQGVAGQVFDASGKPVMNYVVKVVGTFNGQPFSQIAVTGMVSGNPYGMGGYEIVLGTTAINSVDLLTIQLFDNLGVAVTNPLPFSTSANCSQNLVLINFKSK